VFALVSRNQTLKLAFEYFLLAGIILWFKSIGGIWLSLLLVAVLTYLYFKTGAQSSRFLIAATVVGLLIFVFPVSVGQEIYFSLIGAALMYLVIGVKNIVFLNRKLMAQAAYFLIFGTAAYLLFVAPSLWKQVLLFILTAVLFKELYSFLFEEARNKILVGLVLALVVSEAAWAASLLPISPLLGSLLLMIVVGLLHYLITKHPHEPPHKNTVYYWIGVIALIFASIVIFLKQGPS